MGVVRKRPQVLADLEEQAQFIPDDSLEMALRFLDAAESTFKDLAGHPNMGIRCQFDNPVGGGSPPMAYSGFEKHLIFYRPIENGVDVVRVIHGARDIESVFEEDEPEKD